MVGWCDLTEELGRWEGAGLTARFWWRDDDAVQPTAALERLLTVSEGVPLALSVIPGLATLALAHRLRDVGHVSIFQHGWVHVDHSQGNNSEYPSSRSDREVLNELTVGRDILKYIFADKFQNVFVPPWHGLDPRFVPLLKQSGISGISSAGQKSSIFSAHGILQENIHIPLIRWLRVPEFGEEGDYIAKIINELNLRRCGAESRLDAIGVVSHHLYQDDASYEFIFRLSDIISSHRAARWADPAGLFLPDNGEISIEF